MSSIASQGSVVQQVTNGELIQNTSSTEKKSQMQQNKDMFMQLLVAEMQYQDPLEPTDNSQYVQQLYSMSQTESILSVQEDMENLTARNMVGKYVSVQDPVSGEFFDGKVDSVADAGGGVLKVSINGSVYDVSDVKQVHDNDYFMAVTASDKLTDIVKKLPSVEDLRIGHKEDLEAAVEAYNAMNDYVKGFLDINTVNKLTDLVGQMNLLIKNQEALDKEAEEAMGADGEDEVVEKIPGEAAADTEDVAEDETPEQITLDTPKEQTEK